MEWKRPCRFNGQCEGDRRGGRRAQYTTAGGGGEGPECTQTESGGTGHLTVQGRATRGECDIESRRRESNITGTRSTRTEERSLVGGRGGGGGMHQEYKKKRRRRIFKKADNADAGHVSCGGAKHMKLALTERSSLDDMERGITGGRGQEGRGGGGQVTREHFQMRNIEGCDRGQSHVLDDAEQLPELRQYGVFPPEIWRHACYVGYRTRGARRLASRASRQLERSAERMGVRWGGGGRGSVPF